MEFIGLFFGGLIAFIILMWLFDRYADKPDSYNPDRDSDYLDPNYRPSIDLKNVPKSWRPKK